MQQNYLLELDGKASGRFFGFTGGSMHGDVVTTTTPAGGTQKHISAFRFEDITLSCGTGMSSAFYNWIGTSFGSSGARKNGAIVHLDHAGKPDARIEFGDAIVTALVLPELNSGGSHDAVMSVSISPEIVKSRNDAKAPDLGVYTSALPKAWNISSFRLSIDKLNTDTAHVSYVSSLTLGNKLVAEAVGSRGGQERISTRSDYSNIVIKLPETYAEGFYKWLDDTLLNGIPDERSGSLEFFAPSSSKAYFAVGLTNLGIISAATQNAMRTKSALPLTVTMYCEKISFRAEAAAIM